VRQNGKATYQSGDALSVSPMGNEFHRFDESGRPLGNA
jgi:multiple sugar transport system ATP-binding protein